MRYADLSVEAIITAGGISRSTFYVYFDDKGDLLVAMAQDVIGDLLADGASWWELPVDGTREDLRKALRVPIDTYRKHRTILGAIAETAAYDPRAQEQQQNLIDQVVSALTTYIGDAQRAGVADAHLDAARTAQWLIWMIERGLYQLVGTADDDGGRASARFARRDRLAGGISQRPWRGEPANRSAARQTGLQE